MEKSLYEHRRLVLKKESNNKTALARVDCHNFDFDFDNFHKIDFEKNKIKRYNKESCFIQQNLKNTVNYKVD